MFRSVSFAVDFFDNSHLGVTIKNLMFVFLILVGCSKLTKETPQITEKTITPPRNEVVRQVAVVDRPTITTKTTTTPVVSRKLITTTSSAGERVEVPVEQTPAPAPAPEVPTVMANSTTPLAGEPALPEQPQLNGLRHPAPAVAGTTVQGNRSQARARLGDRKVFRSDRLPVVQTAEDVADELARKPLSEPQPTLFELLFIPGVVVGLILVAARIGYKIHMSNVTKSYAALPKRGG